MKEFKDLLINSFKMADKTILVLILRIQKKFHAVNAKKQKINHFLELFVNYANNAKIKIIHINKRI